MHLRHLHPHDLQKTFDAILATPLSIDDLTAAELAWAAVKSVIYGLTIMFVVALFGIVDSPLLLLSVPMIFLCGLIFAEVSMITTALVPVITYDHRCALCGVRIITPEGHTVVDAAHIIPWSRSKNDDIRNGMAFANYAIGPLTRA